VLSVCERLSLVLLIALWAAPGSAQIKAERFSAPAPDSLAAALRPLFAPDGVRVSLDGTTLEFWWVGALPAAAWAQLPEGALIGAVRVTGPFKDIRGKTVKPGVYTLRYALQPQNGDHLGASPFREHLLLSPAPADTDPKPLGFDGTVAISKQTIGASHPAALSVDPPESPAAPLTAHANDLDHKGLTFEIKATGGSLKFGLILIGVIEQ
jgi:hypothetical protein